MHYFVTGGTGFIGRYLVANLLRRGGTVYLLVRKESKQKLETLQREWPTAGTVIPVWGDIASPYCGVSTKIRKELAGTIKHFFHLAAIYDLDATPERNEELNVGGTAHALELVEAIGKPALFHHISSIAVAGSYKGPFDETMFDVGQKFDGPYFATKYRSEALVRERCTLPFRIYRPGIVIGSSRDGIMDKIDGPYYFFKLLQNLRGLLPQWIPMLGPEGGDLNLVPVDYVADALDHIAHAAARNQEIGALNGKVFHLVDPEPMSLGDAANEFCRAAHAPEFAMRIDTRILNMIPPGIRFMAGQLPILTNIWTQTLRGAGIPPQSLRYMLYRSTFPCRNTLAVLAGSEVRCPQLPEYAWKIWDYWERNLDPALFRTRSLEQAMRGKIVMITGASSGIGRAVALRAAALGAVPILVARRLDVLEEVRKEIVQAGGTAHIYPCDLVDVEQVRMLARQVIEDLGVVDILVNNAGRSIRRTIAESEDRFHDFQRTMQLNYFGAIALIMGLLPSMRGRRNGHIINISSIGVQTNAPRFSAYVASKAALDAFSRCISAEVMADGIALTTIHMPLVRTPMIAPTKIYKYFPAISPDDAADMVLNAMLNRPKVVSTRLGTFTSVAYALTPKLVDYIQSIGYRLFPSSESGGELPMTTESVAFAHLMKGIHW